MASEGQGFVRPVPVAVTTVRLVREAEIQLRRPRLHLIPLELRTHSPRPITLVSLQGRLPTFTDFVHRRSTMTLGCSERDA